MDNERLSKLRGKLLCSDDKTFNLEKTRQWVVLPFLHALGYDIMSDEVEPTYVDAKKGYNKYDFTLRVDGTRIALIKCKSFKEMFMPADIDMLSNSFHDKKVSLAILTNGYDYQFYRKEPKSDFMEKHPFCSLNMSLKLDDILAVAEPFSRENVMTVGMEKITGLCDVRSECKLLEKQLGEGMVPEWLAKTIIAKAKAVGVDVELAADMLLETFKSLTNLGKIELENKLYESTKQTAELKGKLNEERQVLNNKISELAALKALGDRHSEEIQELRDALTAADNEISEKSSELVRLMVQNGDLTEEIERLKKNKGTVVKDNPRDKRTIELLEGNKEVLKHIIMTLERRLICGGDTKIKLKTRDDVLTDKVRVNIKRISEEITLVEYLRGELGKRKIRAARVSDRVYGVTTPQDLLCLIIALIIHNKVLSTSDVIDMANSIGIEMYDRPVEGKSLHKVLDTDIYRKAMVRSDKTDELIIKLLVEANIDEKDISIIV